MKITIEDFQRAAATIVDTVVLPQDTVEIIKWMCLYFSEDSEFEKLNPEWLLTEKPSFKKGICLVGPNGSGKTFTFEVFHRLATFGMVKRYFGMTDAMTVASDVGKNGVDALGKYTGGDKVFNELAAEQVAKFYGNDIDAMCAVIFERDKMSAKMQRTHATTNFNNVQIAERYGAAFFSRIRGLCNIVQFGGANGDKGVDLRGFSQRINPHLNYADLQYRWEDYFGLIKEIENRVYPLHAIPTIMEEIAHRLESVKCLYPGVFGPYIDQVQQFLNNNIHPENHQKYARKDDVSTAISFGENKDEANDKNFGIGDAVKEALKNIRKGPVED